MGVVEKISIKSKFFCDNYWNGFLPLGNVDWINYDLSHKENIYNIRLGVESLEEDIQDLNRPYTIKKIKRRIFQGKYLTIIVTLDVKENNLNALKTLETPFSPYKYNTTPDEILILEIYNEVKDVLSIIVDNLIDNLRNQFKQYWIKPSIVTDNRFMDRISWKKKNEEEWNHFLVLNIISSSMSLDNNIGKTEWINLGERLKKGKKSDFAYFLLSRAKSEFSSENMRMAVIECVIALEYILGSYASNLLSSQFELNEDATNTIFEKLGLRKSANIIFENITEFTILEKEHKNALIKGVEIRNQIIHQRSRRIKKDDVKQILQALEKLIKIIFERNESTKGEK